VWASTYDNFTAQLAKVAPQLPVTTGEPGDNWMQSTAADPWKMIFYRESARAYASCLAAGQCDRKDPRVFGFLRQLIKLPEHTWGLPDYYDGTNWSNTLFHAAIQAGQQAYLDALNSYVEQNEIATVQGMRFLADHPLASDINNRMAALQPAVPDISKSVSLPQAAWATPITFKTSSGKTVVLGLDGKTGALATVNMAGVSWADASHLVGQFVYQTYSDPDYATQKGYCCWGHSGRQAAANPQTTTTTPQLFGVWIDSSTNPTVLTAAMTMPSTLVQNYGAPVVLWVQYAVTSAGDVQITLQAFNKTATRMGEALFFSFLPAPVSGGDYAWKMDKLGTWIDPLETVQEGSVHNHGVSTGLSYMSASAPTTRFFAVDTLDATVMSPATPTSPATNFIVPYDKLVGPVTGFSALLFQNAFNTNTPQFSWQPNFRWRFTLRASQ
jgi:hypothetical protein